MRDRSRTRESQSVNERQLLDDIIGPNNLKNRAVHERHMWPGAVGKKIIAPRSVNETHLTQEVLQQLGKGAAEHVTLTVEQTVSSGGATVAWDDEVGAPSEREGFVSLADELEGGSVGDIPIDRTGHLRIGIELALSDVVDVTAFTVTRDREGTEATFEDLSADRVEAITGDVWGFVERGDVLRFELNAASSVDLSGKVQLTIFRTVDTPQATESEPDPTPTLTNGIFVVAGNTGSTTGTVVGYRPSVDEWFDFAAMSAARAGAGGAVVGNRLHVFGGANGSTVLSSHEAFDADADTWTAKTALPFGRVGMAVGVIGGLVYVAGGGNAEASDSGQDNLWRYDPDADSWTTLAAMPNGRRSCMGAVVDGKLYVLGGRRDDTNAVEDNNWMFDPSTGAWTGTAITDMPQAREGHGVEVIDGLIYVVGGRDGDTSGSHTVLSSMDIYDPVDNSWAAGPSMPTARAFGVSAVYDGKLYYIGGATDVGTSAPITDVVERYDPTEGAWETVQALPTARRSAARGTPVVD